MHVEVKSLDHAGREENRRASCKNGKDSSYISYGCRFGGYFHVVWPRGVIWWSAQDYYPVDICFQKYMYD